MATLAGVRIGGDVGKYAEGGGVLVFRFCWGLGELFLCGAVAVFW
ncbi:hypothetical protein P186_2392 [Pyrobaculum ferrireducens]|uniref:Uncharacterized protein n=1 Tax=Pyrobaculum ferrireducens TaxID=1104324 RepID=G7VC92_9CREN|nr:hypothetical protein P186_2392 [Pyrobaculum ferrireducens]